MKAILHDGTELEFPDGTDPAVVQQTVKKVLGQQAAPAKSPGIMDSISNFNSSVANGLTGGFYDELIKAPVQTGVDAVMDAFGAPKKAGMSEGYGANLEAAGKERAKAREDMPVSSYGGEITGAVMSPLAKLLMPTAPAVTTLGKAGNAALGGARLGAVYGAGDTDGSLADRVEGAGMGALVGGAGGAIGDRLAAGASRIISPKVNPDVRMLMDKGVTPTPGQIMGGALKKFEDKLTSVPILGDAINSGQSRALNQFNKAVYNDVLEPIGEKTTATVGRDAVTDVGDKLSNAYQSILPQLSFAPDSIFVHDFQRISSAASNLPANEAKQFQYFVNEKLSKALNSGSMNGDSFKTIESALSKEIASFGKSPDAYQQKLADAFSEVRDALRAGLQRSNQGVKINVNGQTVDASSRLQKINEGWARLVRLERAAGSAGARDGAFTPNQFSSAVKGADQSARKRQFARGDALMQNLSDAGRNVLGDKYPDSGTPGRMIASILGGGGVAAVSPISAGVAGAAMLPYTSAGQKIAAALMTKRPGSAPAVAQFVQKHGPVTGAALARALAQYERDDK